MARKRVVEDEGLHGVYESESDAQARQAMHDRENAKKAKTAKKVAKQIKKRAAPPLSAKKAEKSKAKKLAKVADAFASFRPASETLIEVTSVPTIFVQVDHATGVGGWPTKRFTMVHGPSGRGKTKFVIGLMLSFLVRGHYAYYIDAERTTPFAFVKTLMGEHAKSPRFFAERPDDYEGVIGRVRAFCNGLISKRAAGEIDEDTSAIIVVDSMRKLVPKDMLAEILKAEKQESDENEAAKKEGRKPITTGKDRRAQVQAKMNAGWMDEVIPLLEKSGAVIVAIAREMEDTEAHPMVKKAGWGFKIGGGGALFYDSSLVVRVDRQSYIEEGDGAKKEEGADGFTKKKVYGERHKVTIHKTKIAGHEDKKTVAFFHASNGVLTPEGFDRARDLLEMGERLDVFEKSGSWVSFQGTRIANGRENVILRLTDDAPLMDAIERQIRASFGDHDAPELVVEHGSPFVENTGEVIA